MQGAFGCADGEFLRGGRDGGDERNLGAFAPVDRMSSYPPAVSCSQKGPTLDCLHTVTFWLQTFPTTPSIF